MSGAGIIVTFEDTAGVSIGAKSTDGTSFVRTVNESVGEESGPVGVGTGAGLGDPAGAKNDRTSNATDNGVPLSGVLGGVGSDGSGAGGLGAVSVVVKKVVVMLGQEGPVVVTMGTESGFEL